MLQYKEPSYVVRDIQGEYSFPPHVSWPSSYSRPDFDLWRRKYKNSAVRNLTVLLLFYWGISVSDIAVFAGLSTSRVRSLNEATKKRLFGNRHNLPRGKMHDLQRLIEIAPKYRDHFVRSIREDQGNRREIQAALYALSQLISNAKDIAIFHFAVQFARQAGKSIEL